MTRFEYLESLDRLLASLPYSERREIMYDFEEHFKEGLNEGKSEEDIIESLGLPDKVAAQYVTALVPVTPAPSNNAGNTNNNQQPKPQAQYQPKKKNGNSIGEIVALSIIMLFFNSIFIGFYLAFWGLLIVFVAAGASFMIAGFAVLISAIIATPVAFLSMPAFLLQYPILMFIISVIFICIGGLMLIAMFYVIKFTCILTARYIKWMIKFIRGF